MRRIFDDAADPSKAADLQAKALEQKTLMASKGAEAGGSVLGGQRAKLPTENDGSAANGSKKKSQDAYLDIVLQQQITKDLNGMMGDLDRMGKDLHAIDLRMAERQQTIDFITQNIFDVDDLRDESGERNARVQAILKKHSKEHLSDDEAYLFITQELAPNLYEEQEIDQKARDSLADEINRKREDYQKRIQDGRDAGMDMTEFERQEAELQEYIGSSVDRAEDSVRHTEQVQEAEASSDSSWDFIVADDPSYNSPSSSI